ncbi:MAG: hypothetical protein ACR5LA_04180 [Wolbachia sp.]
MTTVDDILRCHQPTLTPNPKKVLHLNLLEFQKMAVTLSYPFRVVA